MSDKIQISEKQASEMLNNVHTTVCHPSINYDATITRWRQEGYIKQSQLNYAREFCIGAFHHTADYRKGLHDAAKWYELAIAELLEDKSNG